MRWSSTHIISNRLRICAERDLPGPPTSSRAELTPRKFVVRTHSTLLECSHVADYRFDVRGGLLQGALAMNPDVSVEHVVSVCPLCFSDEIHDTGLRALDQATQRLFLVYECNSCTGRSVADRPEHIEKVEGETADAFASPERIARQRAHFAWKRIFDENDYPYSLIPLIERWSPGKRVLDLGCGASQLLPMLMKRGFDAVGFEGDPARAQVARENGVTIVSGDWRKIADIVGPNRFDCVVSDQVFEHMLDPVDTLRSLKPVLADGGVVIFRFPNEGSWRR